MLILGSFPSEQSLRAGEYYANPRNHFWQIIETLFGVENGWPYEERLRALLDRRIALWDVIAACRRPGSADARIQDERANPLAALLPSHPALSCVAFNGGKAWRTAHALAPEMFGLPGVRYEQLPSTSPAHAIGMAMKVESWRKLRTFLQECR